MKKTTIIPLTIFLLGLFTSQVLATEVTPSTVDLENKVKDLVQSSLSSQEASLKAQSGQFFGYRGIVKQIKSDVLTLESDETIQIKVTENTSVQDNGQNIKLTSIPLNSQIIAFVRKNGTSFTASRIVTFKPTTTVRATVMMGKTKDINLTKKELILTVKGKDLTLNPSSKTKIKFSDFQAGQNIIAIIKEVEKELYLTKAQVI